MPSNRPRFLIPGASGFIGRHLLDGLGGVHAIRELQQKLARNRQ